MHLKKHWGLVERLGLAPMEQLDTPVENRAEIIDTQHFHTSR